MDSKPEKMERIAARLQRRIAELSAQYELDIILLQDRVDELEGMLGDSEKKEGPGA